ncbi:Heterokaryon incompatibility protein [Fusarium heterosporum]|uniref:Heterokaryon incompatibility protein n=1 Tax=Fusarium heterosporum TaxID=42747 RepID=A0A8H5WR50_FUSHE|nr:Heterokaryon incompatibility protein [Fusarium heterosporum]
MNQHDFYQTPLDSSKPEIRLLELLEDGPTIKCKLHTVTFNKELRFAALSYVWGDAADTTNISIHGVQVPVSRTLADALKHVRKNWAYEYPDRDQSEFRIWVDAVCINQADKTERSEQVKLMRDIYSSADIVLGWLGAEDDDQIITAACAIKVLGGIFRAAKWEEDNLMSLQWLKTSGLVNMPSCDRIWKSIDYLGTLSYWTRVWILQENVLATTLFYVTPRVVIEYMSLMSVFLILRRLSERLIANGVHKPDFIPSHVWLVLCPPELTGSVGLRHIQQLGDAKLLYLRKATEHSAKTLRQIDIRLSQFGSLLQATDPRDHVFGLLGLISLPIKPDYTKSVKEVYKDYCKAILKEQEEQASEHLAFMRDGGSGVFDDPLDLPSWAPQFPSKASGVPTLVFYANLRLRTLVPDMPFPQIFGDTLHVSGIKLQTLGDTGGPSELQDLQKGGDTAEWIQNYVRRIPSYPTKIPSIWALFLVVMRLQKLGIDTPTMLMLLQFVARLNLDVPESEENSGRIPKYFQTPDVDGLSVGVSSGGGNNPQLMMCVSPLLGLERLNHANASSQSPHQFQKDISTNLRESLDKREFEVSARLIYTLKRNYHTRIFETDAEYLGMGPQRCEPGDIICLLDGYHDLALLRRCGEVFEYVGPCMVYGVTDMYIKRRLEAGDVTLETFDLV